jgi:hypothetical protein
VVRGRGLAGACIDDEDVLAATERGMALGTGVWLREMSASSSAWSLAKPWKRTPRCEASICNEATASTVEMQRGRGQLSSVVDTAEPERSKK